MEFRASTAGSAAPESVPSPNALKRKRDMGTLATPPVTPAKRQKVSETQYEVLPIGQNRDSSRGSSEPEVAQSSGQSEISNGDAVLTDATTPPPREETPGPIIYSPKPTRVERTIEVLKQEDTADTDSVQQIPDQIPEYFGREINAITQTDTPPSSQPMLDAITVSIPTFATPPSAVRDRKIMTVEFLTNQETPRKEQSPVHSDSPAAVELVPSAVLEPPVPAAPTEPTKRRPGRPRKSESQKKTDQTPASSRSPAPSPPPPKGPRQRVPGDYTLTPLLLAEPEMAWIHCKNCDTAFVQKDAYFTKANCPRCERHSKLYGYVWPKTEPAGPSDAEERILDHREVHRFLDPAEEAKIRGRQYAYAARLKEQALDDNPAKPRGRVGRPKGSRKRVQEEEDDDEWGLRASETPDAGAGLLRRSGRARRASARLSS